MAIVTEVIDTRDDIYKYMEDTGRSLKWLATKSNIKYNTLYSILRQKTMYLTQDHLDKINPVLSTKFKL